MRRFAATASISPFKRIPARLTLSILSGGAACRAVFRCASNEKPSRAGGTSGQRAACCSELPYSSQNIPSCCSELLPFLLANKRKETCFHKSPHWIPWATYPPGPFPAKYFQRLECYLTRVRYRLAAPLRRPGASTNKRKATFFRISLYWIPATTYPPGPFPAKYFQRLEA